MNLRVQTGSRLHMGLLSFPGVRWSRHWGGVGLIVEHPGVDMTVTLSTSWISKGPGASRALEFAKELHKIYAQRGATPVRIEVQRGSAEHVGLGTGTQLAMSVASAVRNLWKLEELSTVELVQQLKRGLRSALGVHGFLQGGFLVDGGKARNTTIAPLVARVEFPDWPVLLLLPRNRQGIHGQQESQAFGELGSLPLDETDRLSRMTLLGLLPFLHERDFAGFSETLHEFNYRVGELFRPAQGGTYSWPLANQLQMLLRSEGILGMGQSSWGPTMFAICKDLAQAQQAAAAIRTQLHLDEQEVIITKARNTGANLTVE